MHVGVGTFMPVRTERLEEHTMHAEHYSVPREAARIVEGSQPRRRGWHDRCPYARDVGRDRRGGREVGALRLSRLPLAAVDSLLTNFHLPRSTLLAMVMSFGGEDLVREAYTTAVNERYRFYSFGDAMLLLYGGRRQ